MARSQFDESKLASNTKILDIPCRIKKKYLLIHVIPSQHFKKFRRSNVFMLIIDPASEANNMHSKLTALEESLMSEAKKLTQV